MTDRTELRMNVAALKRVDPYVKDILETATHVALYTFNADENEWEKTHIEGALFVYSRNGEPYNSILIMNRFLYIFYNAPRWEYTIRCLYIADSSLKDVTKLP